MSLSTFFSLVVLLAASGLASAGPKVQNEVPAGTMNGTNAVFQFAAVPFPSSVQIYKNGIRLAPAVDFTLSTQTIVFKAAQIPVAGDVILADYEALVPLTSMQMVNKLTNDCLANQAANQGLDYPCIVPGSGFAEDFAFGRYWRLHGNLQEFRTAIGCRIRSECWWDSGRNDDLPVSVLGW